MTTDQIKQRIIEILISQCIIEEADGITDETLLRENLDMDSLDHVELIMAVEKDFGIVVPDDEVEPIKTIGEVVKKVKLLLPDSDK